VADRLYYITYHEDEDKIKNGITRLIYAYMCRIARFKPQSYLFKGKIEVQLGLAQLATSTNEIIDHLSSLEIEVGKRKALEMIKQLQDLELITIDHIKQGKKSEGSLITILSLKNYLETLKQAKPEPMPAQQPQGIQPEPEPINETQPEPMPDQMAQGVQHFPEPINAFSEPITEPITEPMRELQRQEIQPFSEPITEPITEPTNIKVIKNLSNKDLNNILKEQQKIAQPQSIVKTFSSAFKYILDRFENEFLTERLEANKSQITAIREFSQQMDLDLLTALFNEAAEGSRSNPASYFFRICRENLQKGITTLDKKTQSAAQWQQERKTGTEGNSRKDPNTFATRRGAVQENYPVDDLPF
jgi:hypothetical protein